MTSISPSMSKFYYRELSRRARARARARVGRWNIHDPLLLDTGYSTMRGSCESKPEIVTCGYSFRSNGSPRLVTNSSESRIPRSCFSLGRDVTGERRRTYLRVFFLLLFFTFAARRKIASGRLAESTSVSKIQEASLEDAMPIENVLLFTQYYWLNPEPHGEHCAGARHRVRACVHV